MKYVAHQPSRHHKRNVLALFFNVLSRIFAVIVIFHFKGARLITFDPYGLPIVNVMAVSK